MMAFKKVAAIAVLLIICSLSGIYGFNSVAPKKFNRISIATDDRKQDRLSSIKMLLDPSLLDSSMLQMDSISAWSNQFVTPSLLVAEESTYSSISLYFTLGLYVLTLPGLFSLVTRSVKVKPTQKTYDLPGPANPTAKPLRMVAAEIMAYFKALNYEVENAEEVIRFKGVMGRSNSQAAFLTFCTFMGLGSLGLVISVLFPDVGSKAYVITLLSPYAGIYYWNNAQRVDEVAIKMETSDDDQITSIIAQGGKEDLERFSKALNLPERGKVYVKGLFESEEPEVMTPIASIDTTVDKNANV